MQNPFRPGNGIEPPYLAGREKILRDFEGSLDEFEHGLPRNLIVFGLRGTGKTVVLKHFLPIAETKGWVTVSREFSKRFCDEEKFAEAIADDIVTKLSEISLTRKLQEEGKKLIEKIKPAEITIHGITYKPFYKKERELLDDYLKDMLVKNWNAFVKVGVKGLVFLYDEFHNVEDNKLPGNYPLASLLSALSYAQREGCRYYLVVSGLPNLTTNLKEAKTYTERMFIFREMANLTTSEAHKAIKIPIEKSGYSFEEKLTRQIIEETRGYPYFLQFYSYYLVKNAKNSNIRLNDYKKLRSNLINELDLSFYQDRLNKATPVEQDVLEAMARSGVDEISPTSVLKILKIKKSMLFAYLRNLIDKNLVYKSNRGKYSFTVPLFREFLLRQCKRR